jgi:4-hydroxyacetophenone monooxygenase
VGRLRTYSAVKSTSRLVGVRQELLEASDEVIEDAVSYADPVALRGLLYQLTGDEEVAATDVTTVLAGFGRTKRVTREEDIALLQRKAEEFLKSYRDSGAGVIGYGPEERLPTSVNLTVGEQLDDAALGLCTEELALDPWARGLEWRQTPSAEQLESFSVTVIGAGMAGLNVALMLKRAGIPYTVIEKNSGVGGTWYENRYPGARVDTPSRGYMHIYGVDYPNPNPFCAWTQNQQYFDWQADAFQLRDNIVFDAEVRSLTWDDPRSKWEIEVDTPGGRRRSRSNAVITAVGFLNRPKVPEIEGLAEFQGRSWHTAGWPENTDVAGARLAVVGTGCTGYQTIPELAVEAEHVVVFQRTPQWLFPVPGYRSPFPPQVTWLDRNFPYYTNFMRLRTIGARQEWVPTTSIDPNFDDPHAVSALNKHMREASIAFLEQKLRDRELVAKMTPEHPPWSARPVMVDPDYSILDALLRDNVTLVTNGIRRVNAKGIESNDGTQYDVDVIVFATGFHANEYLFPMRVVGRRGMTLEELWREGGARAHRFSMMPGFPNLWTIYGPNTNGGLLPASFHELATRYALECIEHLILWDKKRVEPREDAYRRFNQQVDEQNAHRVWSDPRADNYYWSTHSRSAVMCPFNGPEVWRFLRHPDLTELEVS